MKKFIRELRRREVFRTAGLYVGICWILIEVGSVVLPLFDVPEWLLQAAIVATIVGFPVILVLAWFFDVSNAGISLQSAPSATVVPDLGPKKSDLVIIGVLALALSISLILNVTKDAPAPAAVQPVSLIVADIDNETGDPVFEDVLELALVVGIEVAPHVTVLDRGTGLEAGRENRPASLSLDLETARDIARHEGIDFVVSGSMQVAGNGFRINVVALDVASNRPVFELREEAESRDAVLPAVGEMAMDARRQLGDKTVGNTQGMQAQAFAAASLESAQAYATGKRYESAGDVGQAIRSYRKASNADADSGRALSSLALLEFERGNDDIAAEYWNRALPLLGNMTERERLRALGRYETSADTDESAAFSVYTEFVNKYPADAGAREKLAAAAFRRLDFKSAIEHLQSILQLYPRNTAVRSQLALYALAAGDWETSSVEANRVIAINPDQAMGYLPIALGALAQGQVDAARDTYASMWAAGGTGRGSSIAELGLADIDLFVGNISVAQERLQAGIRTDIANGDNRAAALKSLALAGSHVEQQNLTAAVAAATSAVSLSDDLASNVLAAMIYVSAGDFASVRAIVDVLADRPDSHSRAYASMLNGLIHEAEGARPDAILSLRRAISTADLWLIRYVTGKVYLRAGNYPEALGELTTLTTRKGEAVSAFLDAMPTCRLLAELPYWTGRAQEELNLRAPARASYREYAALRPQGGVLAQDALERAARLD